jgi:co-chaperonin GroES (HSP10)
MEKLLACKNYVIASPMDDSTTPSGLVVTGASEKKTSGVVTAIGPEVQDIQEGDTVFFNQFESYGIEFEGKPHIVLKDTNICAIVKK